MKATLVYKFRIIDLSKVTMIDYAWKRGTGTNEDFYYVTKMYFLFDNGKVSTYENFNEDGTLAKHPEADFMRRFITLQEFNPAFLNEDRVIDLSDYEPIV